MIQVENLTKLYGELVAVDDLSFSVSPREVLGLVGPNGAGKTTTLRSLVGIVRPTRGTIRIGNHDLEQDPVAAKRQLAFMPDEPHLFDYLTVEEHLRFTARLYGVPDVDRRLPALLAELELSDKARVLPAELSRGMRQKLAFCCAWLPRPRLVLLDEPLSGLDPRGIRSAKGAIRELAA
ncbi:MAG TPA: ABC transporter ATP-binding protein, partial [Gemmatimonadales bacterium]|nr:ABC transporter ATP-binding protein [Gemmatimonadales bacterium]